MNDITIRKRKVTGYAKRQNQTKTHLRHVMIFTAIVTSLSVFLYVFGTTNKNHDNGIYWEYNNPHVSVKTIRQSEVNEKELLSALQPRKQIKRAYSSGLTKSQRMAINGQRFIQPPKSLQIIIDKASKKHGVSEGLMASISHCESGHNPKAQNQNRNGTGDSGVAQINDVHLSELKRLKLNRDNPTDAYEFMAILLKRNGTRDYKASEICWREAVKIAVLDK